MRIDVLKMSMITALGIFIATADASAANSSNNKKNSPSSKKNTTVNKKPTVVAPSKVVYKKPTPTVKVVRTLPATSVIVKNKGIDIHISNGLFFRFVSGNYVSIAAPIGLRVKTLPVGYSLVRMLDRSYYYYQGTYYLPQNNEYVVVDAPEDIIVSTLPEEAEQITIEGKDYYIYGGKIYSIVHTPDGKAFQVTGELSM